MARTKEIDFVAVRRDERIYVQGCRNPILGIIKNENIIKKENKRRRNLMKAEIAEVFMNPVRQKIIQYLMEEVMLRLFVMSLLSFVLWKIFYRAVPKEKIPVRIFACENFCCSKCDSCVIVCSRSFTGNISYISNSRCFSHYPLLFMNDMIPLK